MTEIQERREEGMDKHFGSKRIERVLKGVATHVVRKSNMETEERETKLEVGLRENICCFSLLNVA